MPRIVSTGKQFLLNISPDVMKAMGWKKGTELLICKVPGQNQVYLEEIKGMNDASDKKKLKGEKKK